METRAESLYDHPKYYELVFGSDWKAEFDFLEACFERFASGQVQRVFEPACGTGRLIYRLAGAGYDVRGLDLNPHAVRYCNDRFQRHGLDEPAWVGDMTDFRLRPKADAGFNMINSFRHLLSEDAARRHLECMARAVRRGGLYLLGLHLTPTRGEPMEEESWSARRGNLGVATSLKTVSRDMKARREVFIMTCHIYTPTTQSRIDEEMVFRTYTADQMERLLRRVPGWTVAATYDFRHDIRRPIEIDAETEDVVYVLKRC